MAINAAGQAAVVAAGQVLAVGHLDQQLGPLGRVAVHRREVGQGPPHGLNEIVAHIGNDAAKRTGQSRDIGNDDRRHSHFMSKRSAMQRSGTAKCEYGKFPRIETALKRDKTNRAGHGVVDDPQHRSSRLLGA